MGVNNSLFRLRVQATERWVPEYRRLSRGVGLADLVKYTYFKKIGCTEWRTKNRPAVS